MDDVPTGFSVRAVVAVKKRPGRKQRLPYQQRHSRYAQKYFEMTSGEFVLKQTVGVPIRPVDIIEHNKVTKECRLRTHPNKEAAIAFEEEQYADRIAQTADGRKKFIPVRSKLIVPKDQEYPFYEADAKRRQENAADKLEAKSRRRTVDLRHHDIHDRTRFRKDINGAFYRLHASDPFNACADAFVLQIPDDALYEKVTVEAIDHEKIAIRNSKDCLEFVNRSGDCGLVANPPYKDTWASIRSPIHVKKRCFVIAEPSGDYFHVRLAKNKTTDQLQLSSILVHRADLKFDTLCQSKNIEQEALEVQEKTNIAEVKKIKQEALEVQAKTNIAEVKNEELVNAKNEKVETE